MMAQEADNFNFDDWVSSFMEKVMINGLESSWEKSCTIYKKTSTYHDHDHDQRIEPRLVSIGPYHRGKQHLLYMEVAKWRTLHHLFFCVDLSDTIKGCLRSLLDLEGRGRGSYSELIAMKSEEFLEMLFLDGCFIIDFLLTIAGEQSFVLESTLYEQRPSSEKLMKFLSQRKLESQSNRTLNPLKRMFCSSKQIILDLILLENQIPFFVIMDIWKHLGLGHPTQLQRLAIKPFVILQPHIQFHDHNIAGPYKIHHLLHLLHCTIQTRTRPVTQRSSKIPLLSRIFRRRVSNLNIINIDDEDASNTSEWIPSAAELRTVRISFATNRLGNGPFDIVFENNVIRIPQLRIYDYTKIIFQNLVDFEMSIDGVKPHCVSAYVKLMGCILRNPEDVEVLQRKDIILNGLKCDKEVVRLFIGLSRKLHYGTRNHDLQPFFGEILRIHRSRRDQWITKILSIINKPMIIMSMAVAIIMLPLTCIQTFYTWYAYAYPPK